MSRVGLLALIAVCGTAAASSVGAAPGGRSERPKSWELRDCGSRGESNAPQRPPAPAGPRIGPLTFWPSVHGPSGRTGRATWPFVVKAPVALPARVKVVLAIAPEAASKAAFQHRYLSAVRFEACKESVRAFGYDGTVGKHTGFPFAIGLKQRSACIPMELWIDGRATPIRRVIPVGRRDLLS